MSDLTGAADTLSIRQMEHNGTEMFSLVDIARIGFGSKDKGVAKLASIKQRLMKERINIFQHIVRALAVGASGQKHYTDFADGRICVVILMMLQAPNQEKLLVWLEEKGYRFDAELMNTRQCIACGESYPSTSVYFKVSKLSYSGLQRTCLRCDAKYARANGYKYRDMRTGREKLLGDALTDTEWRNALTYWNHRCAVCNRPPGLWHTIAADHWIALTDLRSDNPGTVPANIVPLCHGVGGCNNEKSNRDPVEWLTKKLGSRKAKVKLAEIEAYFETLRT